MDNAWSEAKVGRGGFEGSQGLPRLHLSGKLMGLGNFYCSEHSGG